MTVREALGIASQSITRRDAETLLMAVLHHDRAWLLAHPDDALEDAASADLQRLTARRAAREPLQYITGVQEFFGLPLQVSPATLIPRPETEHLVEAVIAWSQAHGFEAPRILDVGTGTGAIALACASQIPRAVVLACDLSEDALQVARANAQSLGLASRVRFVQSDLLSSVPAMPLFDIIASNPPYVPSGDAVTLQPEVVAHEPHLALFAGEDGIDVYRRLIPQAFTGLRTGGLLAMEFGFGQRDDLAQLLVEGWSNVSFLDDYAGVPRVVLAERVTTGA